MHDSIENNPRAENAGQNASRGDEKAGLESHQHVRQLSPAELKIEKKLRKKVDLLIMPVCVLVYLMNFIDR